ncbi:hypothetical protein [Nocardia wallacei]|uniref:hypothetical protein n=1 Tax=Nocardia wallacei TaxID=480035 RepID=UPI0024581F7B|nr:hypothetical protein [Nocardia wallacei]
MPRGGARNRSGPQPDPTSGRSDRRGLSFTKLPAEGYSGEVPDFPLPRPTAREKALWAKVWTYPQASAWAQESWRHETIAMYVRWKVKAEKADATAAAVAATTRLADQIGLTPAGLRENGWVIAGDELAKARAERKPPAGPKQKPERRMRAVPGGSG